MLATHAHLETLNPAQRSAVEHGSGAHVGAGPLLVIAGAGSGKTNTLAHRVAHLILDGADPRRILLLTFSRRAAAEMARRVERISRKMLGDKACIMTDALTWAGTFHGIGARLLREHADRIGLDPAFTIHDREDSADLINLTRFDRRHHRHGLARFGRLRDARAGLVLRRLWFRSDDKAAEHPSPPVETLPERSPWSVSTGGDVTIIMDRFDDGAVFGIVYSGDIANVVRTAPKWQLHKGDRVDAKIDVDGEVFNWKAVAASEPAVTVSSVGAGFTREFYQAERVRVLVANYTFTMTLLAGARAAFEDAELYRRTSTK